MLESRVRAHTDSSCLAPRCIRLAQKLDLTQKETYALAYCALSAGEMLFYNPGSGYDFSTMALLCEMSLSEGELVLVPCGTAHVL